MSSVLDLLLAASLVFPPPVAAFTATSPVAVGQPVIYVDQSYDPAPGHFIVLRDWIGRAASFDTPGPHLVELLVEDDRGLWGVALHVVQVEGATNSPPPPPSPPSRPPAGGTSAPPTASIAPATVP